MAELASIIILGILAQWLAWRLKVPAILPLIIIGLAVGPFAPFWISHEFLGDKAKWLSPIFGGENGLFPGDNLFFFVELAIGIILFEGGLTLKRSEIRSIGSIIGKLITLGSTVTFFGAAVAAHFIMGLSWSLSFLFSGLIIVTGPTVIAPILRNIPLKKDLANILKWEGILIDPIGALVAVLVYDFLKSSVGHGHEGSFSVEAIKHFVTLTLIGFSLGTIAAYALREVIKRHWVPHYLLNVFTLAIVLLVFVGSGLLVPDSGLLTIVVMGTVLANINLPNMEEILYFKESLAVLLISMLFILLSANINLEDLELLLDWRVGALFLAVILLVRPLGVFLSARNSNMTVKEKLFISWVGPRGIVAAGIASLFGTKLVKFNEEALAAGESIPFVGAEYITPLVFMIVLGTVLLNATTAGLMGRMLGVLLKKSNGVLIVGANKAAILIAKYLKNNGRDVVLIDNNSSNVNRASSEGLTAFQEDVYNSDLKDNFDLKNVGQMMAMTSSVDVNNYVLDKFSKEFGEHGSYRLVSAAELKNKQEMSEICLFSQYDDYLNLNEVARDHPELNETEIANKEAFTKLIENFHGDLKRIPLMVKDPDETIRFIPASNHQNFEIVEGSKLVYMGIPFEEQEDTAVSA